VLLTARAGRWYRADSTAADDRPVRGCARQLEWLPQETVLHDGVQGVQRMTVDVAADAAAIGMDILVLGRKASGEHRVRGDFRSHLTLRRADRLLLGEISRIGRAEHGMAALGQAHVSGLLWAVSPAPMHTDLAESVERALDASLREPRHAGPRPRRGPGRSVGGRSAPAAGACDRRIARADSSCAGRRLGGPAPHTDRSRGDTAAHLDDLTRLEPGGLNPWI
jgi:hypothetical protein